MDDKLNQLAQNYRNADKALDVVKKKVFLKLKLSNETQKIILELLERKEQYEKTISTLYLNGYSIDLAIRSLKND